MNGDVRRAAHCSGCFALHDVDGWAKGLELQLARCLEAFGPEGFSSLRDPDIAWRVQFEGHLAIVVANHLRKSLDAAPRSLGFRRFDDRIAKKIRHARDTLEHQDQHLRTVRQGREATQALARFQDVAGEHDDDPPTPSRISATGSPPRYAVATIELDELRDVAKEAVDRARLLVETGGFHTTPS
jgi:hypothetical protein